MGGWNSQDLCIGSAEAADWKKIPEGLWLQRIMSEREMNLKYWQERKITGKSSLEVILVFFWGKLFYLGAVEKTRKVRER